MLKEYSCGAVLYKMEEGEPLFLLIKSKRSKKWGFPKGHIEKDETELDAAKREILEETGIKDLKFIDGFKEEDVYIIDGVRPETLGRITEKHSIYFLAEALNEPAGYDKDEISDYVWANISKAEELLYFPNQRNVVKSAYKKIKKKD